MNAVCCTQTLTNVNTNTWPYCQVEGIGGPPEMGAH